MHRMTSFMFAILFLLTPFFLYAQTADTPSNLSVAIKNAILSDPRSANLSLDQIDTLVESLSAQAADQGMTETDIYWRPTLEQTLDAAAAGRYAADDCGPMPQFVCGINHALGLDGSDKTPIITAVVTIAVILGLLALWVELRHRRRAREEVQTSPQNPTQI